MVKNDWIKSGKFAAFILTYGRSNKVITYDVLKENGYEGPIYFICSDDDPTLEDYIEKFGKENVFIFNKMQQKKKTDLLDNWADGVKDGVVIYARNWTFEVAKSLGLSYFLMLDDDYSTIMYRFIHNDKLIGKQVKDLNWLFNLFCNYLEGTPVNCIALAQGGDYLGGKGNDFFKKDKYIGKKRKIMNSFFIKVEKSDWRFWGRINEDVNAYVHEQKLSHNIFLTHPSVCITQKLTQTNSGGLTNFYLDNGTYVKSFYSVILNPSAVKVSQMITKEKSHRRLHHRLSWKNICPVIIREEFKK